MLCAYWGFLVTARQARSTKHEACARSRWPHAHGADCQQQQADAPAHKNRVFLSRTAKHKAQSMSTKQPILTKRCDFEHKARSTKHKALNMSTKQRQKNWAQLCIPTKYSAFVAELTLLNCWKWSFFTNRKLVGPHILYIYASMSRDHSMILGYVNQHSDGFMHANEISACYHSYKQRNR
jgi:hypothetical protein